MRNKQENKFTMYKTIDAYLDENQPIVSSIQELNEAHQQFKLKYAAIMARDDEKKSILKGKAVSKLMARDTAINSSLGISAALYAYARKINNHDLAAVTNIPKSSLILMRDTELIGALKALKDLASVHLEALEPFGVTQVMFDVYTEKVNMYDSAVGKRETGMVKKKGATQLLRVLFREADEVLTTVDKLVNGLIDDHRDFVRNYNEARFIFNLGIRHKPEPPPQNPPPPENAEGSS